MLGDVIPYESWRGKHVRHTKIFGFDTDVLQRGQKPKDQKFYTERF